VLVALYPCPSFLQKNKNKMTTISCSSIYNSAMISSYTHRHTYIDWLIKKNKILFFLFLLMLLSFSVV
jgi:hypothetical protein